MAAATESSELIKLW